MTAPAAANHPWAFPAADDLAALSAGCRAAEKRPPGVVPADPWSETKAQAGKLVEAGAYSHSVNTRGTECGSRRPSD